jgi:hypothetical protein
LQAVRQDLRREQEDGSRLLWDGQEDLGFPALVSVEATSTEWRRQKFRAPRLSKVPTYRYRSP